MRTPDDEDVDEEVERGDELCFIRTLLFVWLLLLLLLL
jgi:hypothetical protein